MLVVPMRVIFIGFMSVVFDFLMMGTKSCNWERGDSF